MSKKVTEAQIKQWKDRHEDVFQVDVPLDDKGNVGVGYFKKPTLQIMGPVQKFMESAPLKALTILFNGCWLGGDDELKDSEEAQISASKQIVALFKVREAKIKKL